MLLRCPLIASCGCRSGISVNKIRTIGRFQVAKCLAYTSKYSWKCGEFLLESCGNRIHWPTCISPQRFLIHCSAFYPHPLFVLSVFFCWCNRVFFVRTFTGLPTFKHIYDMLLLYITQRNNFYLLNRVIMPHPKFYKHKYLCICISGKFILTSYEFLPSPTR